MTLTAADRASLVRDLREHEQGLQRALDVEPLPGNENRKWQAVHGYMDAIDDIREQLRQDAREWLAAEPLGAVT